MDRKAPRSIKMNGRIIDFIISSNGFFCYTENSVGKIRTPEEIDPLNVNNSTPFEKTIYRNSGTRNYITARVIIQSKQFMDIISTGIDKESVFAYLMDIETNLLICNKIYKDIKKQVHKNRNMKINVRNGVITNMPTINELDIMVYQFLMSAKQVLQIIVSIFNEFHHYTGPKIDGPHINKLIDKMREIDYSSLLLKNMTDNYPLYKLIVDMRNAQEHTNKTRYLEIENYKLHSDNKVYEPYIKFFNNGLQYENKVLSWMHLIIEGLLHLLEIQMMYNVGKIASTNQKMEIAYILIPEAERDEKCPVVIRAELVNFDFVPKNKTIN